MQWSTYHAYKESNTQITFKWKDSAQNELYITIDEYNKMLNRSQAEIMRRLLEHILEEKIECATIFKPKSNLAPKGQIEEKESVVKSIPKISEKPIPKELVEQQEHASIQAEITAKTQKALNLKFTEGKEKWIPRSTIHSSYDEDSFDQQKFIIDTWVLKKNSILT